MQLRLDDLHDALGRHRLDGVLQTRKRADVLGRQQVRPRAQQLPELDKAWPELLERARQLDPMIFFVLVDIAVRRWELFEIVVMVVAHAQLGDDVVELVLAQYAEDLQVALRMLGESAGEK